MSKPIIGKGDVENVYMTGKDEKLETSWIDSHWEIRAAHPQEGIFAEIIEVHDLDTSKKIGCGRHFRQDCVFNRQWIPPKRGTFRHMVELWINGYMDQLERQSMVLLLHWYDL